jgi:hypothetical protein
MVPKNDIPDPGEGFTCRFAHPWKGIYLRFEAKGGEAHAVGKVAKAI